MKGLSNLILVIFVSLIAWHLQVAACYAEIPHLINYQGKLTDSGGQSVTGTKSIIFKIYNVASGSTPLWQETQSVTVSKGVFNVLLGSVVALDLPFDVPYYLTMQVGTDPEMTPRQRISSVGYAYRAQDSNRALQAQNANTVNSIHASTNPEANKLLALDATGEFPTSVTKCKIKSGNYVGNGSGNRHITGMGFQPAVVFIFPRYQSSTGESEVKTSAMGSFSKNISGNDWHENAIKSLDPDGFTLGGSYNVNESGANYSYLAFGE